MTETLIFTVFPVLMIAAGIGDCLTMKIPNWLNGLIIASFFAAAFMVGMPLEQIGWHIATGVGVLIIGFILFNFGYLGGGDAKLIAVASLWLGLEQLIEFLVIMGLAGGLLALVMKFWWWIRLETELRGFGRVKEFFKTSIQLPYGIAIAAGALFAFQNSWWLKQAQVSVTG